MKTLNIAAIISAAVLAAASCGQGEKELLASTSPAAETTTSPVRPGYADVNGLHMYYETVGQGEPVVLLHGAYMSADQMKPITDVLAKNRMVIVPEAQGHARTADIGRDFSYEAMADDVAAMLDQLGIPAADVVGYSMGGATAMQLAIRHPDKVKRMVVASASYSMSGVHPELVEMFKTFTPDMLVGSPFEAEYKKLAPKPEAFPDLARKLVKLDQTDFDWGKDIPGIKAPTLIVIGDQDIIRPEHAADMLRLLGGGIPGDMGKPVPEDQLAILPGTSHIGMFDQKAEMLGQLAADFIDPKPAKPSIMAPPPEAPAPAAQRQN
jgi:pimeloyl-ACP methyl ester carboxylesterase